MPTPLMCEQALLERDLGGKRFIVTGANSGIGWQTARQLAIQGGEVILACRRVEDGRARTEELRAEHPDVNVAVRALDLADLSSVRAFVADFTRDFDALHVLINNAGVMNTPERRTKDGFELQLGVNHLGHFLLTTLLLDVLKESAPARIINVSSCFHDRAMGREGRIDLDDPFFHERDYDGWVAYAQSKLANVLHAKELARRLDGTQVTAVSVHPGWVRTRLAKHSVPLWVQNLVLRPLLHLMGMIEPWEGAQTTLHAALADSVCDHSGDFYSQTGTYRDKSANKGGWPMRSPSPHAHDAQMAADLWEWSAEVVDAPHV